MRILRRPAASVVALALTLPFPLSAQRGEKVTAVEVTLVEVPVYAEKDGEPVRDLAKEDFELSQDGRKVAIAAFDRVDLDAPPAAPAAGETAPAVAPLPPAARRQFLLLFDLAFSQPIKIARAREAAEDFIARGLKDTDVAGVATYDAERGLKLVLSFTGDRAQLLDAVKGLGLEKRQGEVRPDPLGLALNVAPARAESNPNLPDRGAGDAEMAEILQHFDTVTQRGGDEQRRGRAISAVGALQDMARALDSVKGRKHVLYFSEGIDNRLLVGETGANMGRDTGDAVAHGEVWKVNSDERYGRSDVGDRLREMLAVFVRADCVIHAVDLAGLGDAASTGNATLGAANAGAVVGDRSSGRKDSLYRFAKETGGTIVEKSNDLAAGLASVQKKTSVVYVLSFAPTRSEPGKYHDIKVKVKRPGVRVSTRAGFFEPLPFAKRPAAEKRLATAQLVAFGAPREEFGTRVVSAAFRTRRASLFQVPVLVEVPGLALVTGAAPGPLPVEVYAYLLDSKLKVVDFASQVLTFDTKKYGDQLKTAGFKYYATLVAPAGSYTLRVLVRDSQNGRADLVSQSLAVVTPERGPQLLPPFFHEDAAGGWLRAKAPLRAGLLDGEDEPFSAGGNAYVPTALPNLGGSAPAHVSLVAYQLPAGDARVTGSVLDASGTRVGDAKVTLEGSNAGTDGSRRLEVSFAPQGLAAGRYALALHVTAGAAAVDAPPAPFEIAR